MTNCTCQCQVEKSVLNMKERELELNMMCVNIGTFAKVDPLPSDWMVMV